MDDETARGLLEELRAARAERAELRQLLAQQRSPALPSPRVSTDMLEVLKSWARAKKRLASFACDYQRAVKLLSFAPADGPFAGIPLGKRDPTTISATDVDLYRDHRYSKTTRRKDQDTGENTPPRPATINREVMMGKRLLNFAVKRGTIERNPIEGLEEEDEDNIREVVIMEWGFADILSHIEWPVLAAYVTLAYDSAMRRTECLLCRWSWLDHENGFVRIPSAVAKNGDGRTADLSKRAWEALNALPRNVRSEYIFVNPDTGELYDPRWLYEHYRRAVLASSVRGPNGEVPTFHDLRRSWCTLAGRRGIPERVWMSKSGHKDPAVIERYRIVLEDELQDSRTAMEAARAKDVAALASR